ncbi:MAG TPA: sialidase family protein [Candidatus Methylomirabilis sp.]|nr:sialidase family protein [Candidatus Methylomirabilis sp.]
MNRAWTAIKRVCRDPNTLLVAAPPRRVAALLVLFPVLAIAAPDSGAQAPGAEHLAHAKLSLATGVAFDKNGRLWRVSTEEQYVLVRYSDDQGRHFSSPVRVNAAPERIAADGENRPTIAFGTSGEIYVSWTQSLEQAYAGHIRFSLSRDGGRTFSAPITVNDNRDPISHRFQAMTVDPRGILHLVWLDRRDQSVAKARGETYAGIAVYQAVSRDGGTSFSINEKIADHSCECCRIALALDTDGTPVIFWRHVFDTNVRDHALARLDGASALVRVSHDNWAVDACPHHGPALSIGHDGVYHLAWFSGAPGRSGLFYARSSDRGRHFSAPLKFGISEAQAAHPQVLSLGQDVWLAWKEFDGLNAVVRGMHSADGGQSWSAPAVAALTAGASDHPLLIANGAEVFLSWQTVREGYRLIALDGNRP